jgi:hypothetical protein
VAFGFQLRNVRQALDLNFLGCSGAETRYIFGLMLGSVLIFVLWVVVPVAVYRMVKANSGSATIASVAAGLSLVIAVVGLEHDFRLGKALWIRLRSGGTLQ